MSTEPGVRHATSSNSAEGHSVREALENLREVLKKVPPESAPGLPVIGMLKGLWAEARATAALLANAQGGRVAGEHLADVLDRVLRELLDFAGARAGARAGTPGVALLAVGSYGRRELAPYSDLDLMVLHSGTMEADERFEKLVGSLFRPLWDAGFQLGHAVRTPEECLAMMEAGVSERKAHETATALLEARFVAGDSVLAGLFLKRDLPDFFKHRGRPFIEAKLGAAVAAHQRPGASVYRTQPHLKNSPGALRDYQLAMWIDRASQLSGHLPRLAKRPLISAEAIDEARAGYERLLTLRAALHAACGRKQDVLDFAMQEKLSQALGYEATEELRGSERLLREYFQAATAIYRLADTVIRRYREEQALANRDLDALRRRPVDGDFTRIGEHLYAVRADLFAGDDWLALAMRAFVHAARLGVGISQELRAGIRARLGGLDDTARRDPAAAALFLELLGRRANVAKTLRSMRDVGLLGAYLPEFGELEGLVIHDVFHDFTVDEHTLFVVEKVDRLYATAEPADRLRRRILEEQASPVLLRLACLFHDLGKSKGGAGHSRRGALMVPAIGERLGLREADVRTLIFLVEQHLLLSRNSLRRDPGEGGLLQDLAKKVVSRPWLDLLFLLTCADIAAVGQGSFPQWKDELLCDLYRRLDALLAPGGQTPEDAGRELEAQLLAGAADDATRDLAHEHCRLVPRRYLVEVRLEEAQLHVELLKKLRDEKREALAAVAGSGESPDLWVVTRDRPKLFTQICGALLSSGVNVVSALAYTREDGVVLDRFMVSVAPEFGTAVERPTRKFWAKVSTTVEEHLAGEGGVDVRAQLEIARRRIPRTEVVHRRIPPEVRLDNRLSSRYTVVDIVCGDRLGLLYGLSRALSDLACNIHFARVDTTQGLANAVYYITEIGGGQITDAERSHNIRLLLSAVADDFQSAKR
ncbi:MAG: [protein-PII] uridylyltransferase [Planctomycetes bacterium]|nr:[protein-PII] uridylyltransferase [Planctomycetota bacterium]